MLPSGSNIRPKQQSWYMRRPQPAINRAGVPEHISRRDHVGVMLRRYGSVGPGDTTVAERWDRLTQRIRAYQQLEVLIAHMTMQGVEVRRAALLLRPWSSLVVPFA